ncbi:MAG: ester cyclase [Steroidobacterales bacterium]|jgi:predicted ester cyclase
MRSPSLALLGATALLVACQAIPPAGVNGADQEQLARRVLLECLGQGRCEALEGRYAADFIAHGASANYTLAQDTAATRSWRAAMPDLAVSIERSMVDKDMVAVHWKAAGTNTVAAGGLSGNGERMGIEGMTMFRFAGGRIAEEWSVLDVATLRRL